MTSRTVMLIGLAASALAGCAGQTASLKIDLRGPNSRYLWELAESGKLTVTDASAMEAGGDRVLYETTLDEPARKQLAEAIWRSGFLLDARGLVGDGPMGGEMIVEAAAGWLDNRMIIQSAWVDSVGQIVDALNAHLPPRVQAPYRRESYLRPPSRDEGLPPDDDWRRQVDQEMRDYRY